jgi:hypothetical protein
MKAQTAKPKRLDIVGNADCSSDQEILTRVLKKLRQRVGYYSVFAAVPALFASHLPVAHSDEERKPAVSLDSSEASRDAEMSCNNSALKRCASFSYLINNPTITAPLAGTDDCPGHVIPGGTYAAWPMLIPAIRRGHTWSNVLAWILLLLLLLCECSGVRQRLLFTLTSLEQIHG